MSTTPSGKREPSLKLSTVIAGAAAAITATAIAKWLGVAGTLIGAALMSVVTTTAIAIYTRSLEHVVAPRQFVASLASRLRALPRRPVMAATSAIMVASGVALVWPSSDAAVQSSGQVASSAVALSAATVQPEPQREPTTNHSEQDHSDDVEPATPQPHLDDTADPQPTSDPQPTASPTVDSTDTPKPDSTQAPAAPTAEPTTDSHTDQFQTVRYPQSA